MSKKDFEVIAGARSKLNMKKEILQSIMDNPQNRQFFKVAAIHGDRGYTILNTKTGERVLGVKTNHGMAYYEIKHGSVVGRYIELAEVI